MNPGSADQAFDAFLNVDLEWMQQFYAGQTKPPDPGRSSRRTTDEQFEMELVNIINNTNKGNDMIVAPAMGSCDLAAGTKSELEMRRNIAASLMNIVEATSVTTRAIPRSSCGLISNIHDVAAAETTSTFHKSLSVFPTGVAAAAGCLRQRPCAVKVKKKRVRPSRRVPTTMVKTDTSNFKAMVEHFTGLPATTTTATQESTLPPSVSSSSPESTSSATSPSFSKPLPHPAFCKISNSSAARGKTSIPTAIITTSTLPLLLSSLPTCQSLPELPVMSTVATMTGSDLIPNSADPEELTMAFIDAALLDKLWS